MKTKTYIFTFFILFSGLTFGQDWCAWHFSFKFKIDKTTKIYDEIIDIEFYINDPHYFMNSIKDNTNEKALKYNTVSKEYKLNLGYGCISCGYERAKEPPDIYIKISLKNFQLERPFSVFIPIYVEKKNERNDSWSFIPMDLGTIYLSEFVNGYTEENNKILPSYEVIELKMDNSIHKRRKGEYELKRMDKLVKLELENEN